MARKAVFFDLGGTLLVMRRDRVISLILSDAGYRATPEEVHSAYFRVEGSWLLADGNRNTTPNEAEESYRRLDAMVFNTLFPGHSEDEAARVSDLMRSRWPVAQQSVPLELYPDVRPTLERLRGDGYVMALVSNAPPDTAKTIEALGLPTLIPTIVVSGLVGVSKPNPEIFRIALRTAGVSAEETIHVGDLYDADVRGARNAGIEGVLIDREGIYGHTDCPKIASLEEVYRFLR